MYLLAVYVLGDTGLDSLPDREVFLSGKARIWYVCSVFLLFYSLSA